MEQDIRHAKMIISLDRAMTKVDHFLSTQRPRQGQGKRSKEVKSNLTDNESAKMTTGKGTIQGYNGVATVDKKHQIIINAQAFGEGQEHHTLKPVLVSIEQRYRPLGISPNIYQDGTVVTADTGFANEAKMRYLHEQQINGYIPDNRFRSRDPKFSAQKAKYGQRHQDSRPTSRKSIIPASEFQFDPIRLTCQCPAGHQISYRGTREDDRGTLRAYFEGRLLQCRHCTKKHQCMHNPSAADHRHGAGRQVYFALAQQRAPSYTDWMKQRVDSAKGRRYTVIVCRWWSRCSAILAPTKA